MPSNYIAMSLIDMRRMAMALVPHTTNQDYDGSPTAGVWLGGSLGNYAYATDRFTAARYDLTNVAEEGGLHPTTLPDNEVFIPREALIAIQRVGPSALPSDYMSMFYRAEMEVLITDTDRFITPGIIWQGEDGNNRLDWLRKWMLPKNPPKHPPFENMFKIVMDKDGDLHETAAYSGRHLDKFTQYSRSIGIPLVVRTPRGDWGIKSATTMIRVGSRLTGLIAQSAVPEWA